MNFRYKLMQFMSGRYGTDELSISMCIIGVICSVVNIFLRSIILQLIIYILMGFVFFRVFSRNIVKRSRENAFFKEKIGFIERKRDFRNKKKNDKFHVYRKCPYCKAILRLPNKPGKHTTICPKCGKEFKVKVKKRA